MNKILKEKILFDNWFTIEEAEIQTDSATLSRMRLNRPEAAAVLVYHTEREQFILTRQFRYAIYAKNQEELLETVAGKLDPGEEPRQAAIRECREEIGYEIDPARLRLVSSCFASPGYSSELLHLYYAEVSGSDKVSEGGGLDAENEDISVIYMDKALFLEKIGTMELTDSKTILLGLWYANTHR